MSNEYKDWKRDKIEELWERATPKNPTPAPENFYWCPTCERAIRPYIEDSLISIDFCPYCGQALDWEDVQ